MSKPYNNDWYQSLNKPSVVPPNWVFGVVWAILYCMLAASLFLYVRTTEFEWTDGLMFFLVQMACNLVWTVLFFRMKQTLIACVDCVVMLIFTALSIVEFQKVDSLAAQLLYPYICWLCFATYINTYVVLKN